MLELDDNLCIEGGCAVKLPEDKSYLYRYRDITYAPPVDEFDNICGRGDIEVLLDAYEIIKTTPKGDWIVGPDSRNSHFDWGPRFVLASAKRRFAARDKEDAYQDFRARKKAQIRILHEQIARVEIALKKKPKEYTHFFGTFEVKKGGR
jgi:hypothetical protein